MKFLNIIHSDDLVKYESVPYVNYVKITGETFDDREGELIDAPTLVIGYRLCKKLYSKLHKIDPLNKCIIPDKLFWELSFKENAVKYFDGMYRMVKTEILENFFHNMKYVNLDPIFMNISDLNDLTDKIRQPSYTYAIKQMLYVLDNDIVYGIDLKAYKYFDFDIDQIKNHFFKYSLKGYCDDQDNLHYHKFYRIFPEVMSLKRYMVLLMLY